jgi:hypothetical protein
MRTRYIHTSDWRPGATRQFLDTDSQARWAEARFEGIRNLGRGAGKAERVRYRGNRNNCHRRAANGHQHNSHRDGTVAHKDGDGSFAGFGGNAAVEFFAPDYAEQFAPCGRSVLIRADRMIEWPP